MRPACCRRGAGRLSNSAHCAHCMSDEQKDTAKAEAIPAGKSFGDFLVATPPDVVEEISDLGKYYSQQRHDLIYLTTPDLFLHCDSEECHGDRFFRCTKGTNVNISSNNWEFDFIHYVCRNCQKKNKIFSVAVRRG